MDEEVWPPPPAGQPQPVIPAGISLFEQRCGAVSLCLALAGAGLFFAILVASMETQRHGTQTPAFDDVMASAVLSVFVLDALAVVIGVLGRRTVLGKIGMALPLVAILALAAVVLLAPRVLRG